MKPLQRLAVAWLEFRLRVRRPARPGDRAALARDFSTHPGGAALRFGERLRRSFRRLWLKRLP